MSAKRVSKEHLNRAGVVLIYLSVSFCVCDPRDEPTLPCVSSLAGFSRVGSSLRPSWDNGRKRCGRGHRRDVGGQREVWGRQLGRREGVCVSVCEGGGWVGGYGKTHSHTHTNHLTDGRRRVGSDRSAIRLLAFVRPFECAQYTHIHTHAELCTAGRLGHGSSLHSPLLHY